MATMTIDENLPLPKDRMPSSWFEDDRMNAMFAEFRNRSVNPQDWDSKYKFWNELIKNYLSYNKQCSFSILHFNSIFKRNGRTPLCLPIVVNEIHKNGEIITEEQFLNGQPATWTSWAVNTMVKKPMTWSYSMLKNYFNPNVTSPLDTKYIHLKTVRELADIILSLNENGKDLVLSLKELTMKCGEKSECKNVTEDNIRLALLWIAKQKNIGLKISENTSEQKSDCLFKIHTNGVNNLSEADESLFKLKANEKALLEKIEALEIERNELIVKAKLTVDSGLREVAKTHLRKKRELNERIEKHVATLQNLQTLISNIHDAHSNTEILAAYKKGSEVLKGFEKAGLTEFNVRDTMDDITEAVSELSEVRSALSEPLKINDTDLELEEELNNILNEDSNDMSWPSIPDTDVAILEAELATLMAKNSPTISQKSTSQPQQHKLIKEAGLK